VRWPAGPARTRGPDFFGGKLCGIGADAGGGTEIVPDSVALPVRRVIAEHVDHVAAATPQPRPHLIGVSRVRKTGHIHAGVPAVDRDAARGAGQRQNLDHPGMLWPDGDDPESFNARPVDTVQ